VSDAISGAILQPLSKPAAACWLDQTVVGGPRSVAEQLAIDEALLDAANESRLTMPVVRTWQAEQPAVVVGSSSRLAEEVDLPTCQRLGVSVLRRPSGGATVVLGPGCIMWMVVTPHAEPPPIDAIHAAMLDPLAAALTAAGRPVSRQGTSDLTVSMPEGIRKISGNALRVRRRGVLYHGTLLDDFPLELIGQLLRHPPREPAYRQQRSHDAFLANLALGRQQIDAAVRAAFGAWRDEANWPQQQAAELVASRYGLASWTERL
jgi:lipoate-protein ligase A